MDDIIIRIENIKKSYGNITPLCDINCEIKRNEIISIIGGSGCGKSTLIRLINLIERPTSGKIYLDSEDITSSNDKLNSIRQKVGMVFQNYNLFPHMTVIENIMFAPIEIKKMNRLEAYYLSKNLLNKVGLENKMYVYPNQLSGGQKQRVAIARTLAMNPEVILFDEPTSALDPTTTLEIKKVITKLKESNLTALIVTHDMELAKTVSDRIFYLDEGIIYESGTPDEIFNNPKKIKTKDFVKKQKSFSLEIRSKDFNFLDTVAKIDDFLIKLNVESKLKQNVELVFEELCMINLLSNNKFILECKNNILLKFAIEYYMETKEVTCTLKYNYPKIDILDCVTGISKNILDKIIIDKKYVYNPTSECDSAMCFKIIS